jgi:PPOX class probable F420-dependent enzyme
MYMATQIPERFADLLSREKKAFACLAVTLNNGTPQVTPLWFDWDGTHFIVNTARGRVKDKVMRKHPVVALMITDPVNPYRYLQIKGRVVVETEEGAYDQICDLAEKYRGKREYPRNPGETRVTYHILPDRFQTMG